MEPEVYLRSTILSFSQASEEVPAYKSWKQLYTTNFSRRQTFMDSVHLKLMSNENRGGWKLVSFWYYNSRQNIIILFWKYSVDIKSEAWLNLFW